MTIILGTLFAIIPLSILLLIGFAIATMLRRKNAPEEEDKPQALDITYYFGLFISLAATLGSLIGVIFAAINHRFKDILELASYNEIQVGDDVRMSIAVLFIMFPIYLVLSWLQAKQIKKDPSKTKLSIRAVYIYIILFITSITIAGNFIYIVYNLLSGEVAVRFIPKSLTLLVLAAIVFVYHVYLLRRDYTQKSRLSTILLVSSVVLVLASVTWGIVETGTPGEVRARKMDDKRLQDLSQIQQSILNKWQKDGVLPVSLGALNDELSGTLVPVDPRTKMAYEYTVIQNSELGFGVINDQNIIPIMYDKSMVSSIPSQPGTRTGRIAKTDAIFEICATFESVRDVAKRTGQDQYAYKGSMTASSEMYRLDSGYYGQDFSNPTWDHKAERTCFKRTISKDKYQIYGN
jgi:hypothetical protein